MARPEKDRPQSLDEAIADLKRNPARPAHAHVDGLEVELRVVGSGPAAPGLGDRIAAAGPWEGESLYELLAILREGRARGGSAEPPEL